MNSKLSCLLVFSFALAHAGLIPSANILEGPSTRTKVVGPDGSIIDAYAPGGKIILDNNAGPLLQSAPVVLAQPAIPETHLYSPVELQQVVYAERAANGPPSNIKIDSDTVTIEAARIARISEDGQKVFLHPGIPPRVESREYVPITETFEESSATATELAATAETETGSTDLSGAYVPDNFEKLYDDGSYREEHQ